MKIDAASGMMLTLLLTSMLTLAFDIQPVKAETLSNKLPVVYVDPSVSVANPGEYFTINIKIANVTDLYCWGLTITWRNPPLPADWLQVIKAEEGEFLKRGGQITFWTPPKIVYWGIDHSTIKLGCTRLMAAPGETGSGTLATVTFAVRQGGNCTLHVYDTKLFDSVALNPISHTTQDGYFSTTVPLAYFYSPLWSRVTQPVTFNATKSYDPDGGTITSYYWDFGDGTNTTETDPITYHTYTKVLTGTYSVILTVTDDEGESWSCRREIWVWICDIAITAITVCPTTALPGDLININVTAKNLGELRETFNVTVYYDGNIANKTTGISLAWGATTTLTLTWCTTGVPLGVYTIKAVAEIEFDCNLTNNELVDGEVTVAPEYATVDIEPNTLNLKSRGKWITAHIEPPEGYDAGDINVSTILLNEEVPAESSKISGNKLRVSFDRSEVIALLPQAGEVELTITGTLFDGTPFEGNDTIRVK